MTGFWEFGLKYLEKGFQKKTIVAFTNNTVFKLDFYNYVWFHVLALSAWTLKKAHIVRFQGA